jgi:cytochrome c oxidase cbb3-type subunit 4
MDLALLHSVWTVLLFLTFLGIVAWAWSGRRRARFEAAARAPLEEDADAPAAGEHHG